MALSPRDILTALQWDFLTTFFSVSPPFFLTGGTALSAFYLQHRYSEDLDLFTLDGEAFDRVPLYLADASAKIGASAVSLQTAPQFRRYKINRQGESVIVDFVREVVPQIAEGKNTFDGIMVDTVEDIVSNKICTVVSRAEIKDYIDLYCLNRAGYPLENYIEFAQRKDAGVSPAMVAFLFSEIKLSKVPEFVIVPITAAELEGFFKALAKKLAVESFPS
jgi:predicted nucleotidyltransferase component of viral defense system